MGEADTSARSRRLGPAGQRTMAGAAAALRVHADRRSHPRDRDQLGRRAARQLAGLRAPRNGSAGTPMPRGAVEGHHRRVVEIASEQDEPTNAGNGPLAGRGITDVAARATAAALAVGAIGFALWKVRDVLILLLLALTFAAAIRPGVEWLKRHRFPQPAAIASFFLAVGAVVVLFFWAAVPPALRQIEEALHQRAAGGQLITAGSTGIRHDVLTWLDRYLHRLPSGRDALHPVAAYGHQATHAIVATF